MQRLKLKKCKRVCSVHFTPDGSALLVAGAEGARVVGTLDWLDLATGEAERRFEGAVPAYAVAANLSRVAVIAEDVALDPEPVRFTDPRPEGDRAWHSMGWGFGSDDSVFGAAIDAAGTRLAIGIERGTTSGPMPLVNVRPFARGKWDALGPGCLPEVLVFSPDSSQLAVAGDRGGSLRVFNLGVATAGIVHESSLGSPVRAVAFSPDAARLAVAFDRFLVILVVGTPVDAAFRGHPRQVNGVAFSPDGSRLLTACHDGAVRVWGVASAKQLKAFDWGIGAVTSVAFAPDGLTAAAGGDKGQVVVWDVDV